MSTKLFFKSLVTAVVLVYLIVLFLLGGCSGESAPTPEPSKVSVITVHPPSQALTIELAGGTQAFMVAEVRLQVGGTVQ